MKVAAATASVDHNSNRLGLLRKAGLWVRRTSTTASSVNSEIMNHEVWKVASLGMEHEQQDGEGQQIEDRADQPEHDHEAAGCP